MSEMGRELIESMQELVDYYEGKIDLRTSRISVSPVCAWEADRYTPDGAARRLISMLQADPLIPEKYGIVSK